MSFVIYDVETTGLNKRFDQILQFAAVRTDADLKVIDRLDVRVRLMPHIVPAPTALHVNGVDIGQLLNPALPTHYEAVCAIAEKLTSWSPAVFLGFNSIRFDEEFLRQALYLCLHSPFLTNTNGNTRADILNLVRAAAVLAPDTIEIPEEEGRPCFRLEPLARANGYIGGAAHNAANDVDAALHLCRLVAERAPDWWSRFLRFAQRRAAAEFVAGEDAFVYFDQIGSFHSTHIVTTLGACPGRPTLNFCIDLKADVQALAAMDAGSLAEAVAAHPHPIRRLRLNAAPLLIPLYEASPEMLEERSEDEYIAKARALREDQEFVGRLMSAAQAAERSYPNSPHLEEQIYAGDFPADAEVALKRQFHEIDWALRRELATKFADARHRSLAMRLLYLERPDLLSEEQRARMTAAIERRRRGKSEEQPGCMTIHNALAELHWLLEQSPSDDERLRLTSFRNYLNSL